MANLNETENEKFIFKYFLGELEPEECLRVEQRCFENEDFAEKLFAVEDRLIEAYLGDELDPQQRRHFETNYLVTDARREKYELVRYLQFKFAGASAQPAQAPRKKAQKIKFNEFFIRWNRQLAFAFGSGVLCLAFIGLFWLLFESEKKEIEQSQINSHSNANTSVSANSITVLENKQNNSPVESAQIAQNPSSPLNSTETEPKQNDKTSPNVKIKPAQGKFNENPSLVKTETKD